MTVYSGSLGLCVLFGIILCFDVSFGVKCYKDEAIGDREGNVYYCHDPGKPECCEEDSAFTCCEEQTTKSLREQLILWGTVAGVVLLISLACCYFWRDGDCCKGEKSVKDKCCICCRKSSVDDKARLSEIPEAGPSRGHTFHKQPWYHKDQYDDDHSVMSPVPQFKFKSPTYGKY